MECGWLFDLHAVSRDLGKKNAGGKRHPVSLCGISRDDAFLMDKNEGDIERGQSVLGLRGQPAMGNSVKFTSRARAGTRTWIRGKKQFARSTHTASWSCIHINDLKHMTFNQKAIEHVGLWAAGTSVSQ